MNVELAGLRAARTGAVLCGVLIGGCAALRSGQPSARPPGGAAPPGAAVVDPAARPAAPMASATAGAHTIKSPTPASAPTSTPIAKASAKPAPSAAPAPPAGKLPSTAPALAKPSAPTLDLASLEKRLRETNALGVVTKITLKNQVDDLLDQFRAFYQGSQKTTLSALRQPYDRLLMKVLALLQDSDPQLASAISASREAIWGILSDPVKFSAI